MAFSLFKKKAPAPVQKKKESTLVPVQQTVHAPSDVPIKKKEAVRDWKQFPVEASAILSRPLMTEKAMRLAQHNTFSFEVALNANKLSVKKAFYNCYGVMPTSIKILRIGGKKVRYGRTNGVRKEVKKALVSVPRSASITI